MGTTQQLNHSNKQIQWPEQSLQLLPERSPVERLPESRLDPRLPESPLLLPTPPVVLRSLTDTSPVPSLSERFDDTRSPLSSSSESSPSSDLSERLPRTSRPISDSSLP